MTACTVAASYHKERQRTIPHPVVLLVDSAPHSCDNNGTLNSRCQNGPDPRAVFGVRPFPPSASEKRFCDGVLMAKRTSNHMRNYSIFFCVCQVEK